MRVHNGDTAIITFTGVGYDKRIMGETMPITDQQDLTGVPGVQSVAVPGQVSGVNVFTINLHSYTISYIYCQTWIFFL